VARRRQLEADELRTIVEKPAPDLREITMFIADRQEMVAGKLADAAGEARASVWHQQFCLTEARWVPENLSRGRVARGVLMGDSEIVVGEWYPSSLSTPAGLDELSLEGKTCLERGGSPGCTLGFEHRGE